RVNVPFGNPVRFTTAVMRDRFSVFTRLPLILMTALTQVMCGSFRTWIGNRRRLAHAFLDGRMNATDAAIGFGVSCVGVPVPDVVPEPVVVASVGGVSGFVTIGE